jgi:hypothetical protein
MRRRSRLFGVVALALFVSPAAAQLGRTGAGGGSPGGSRRAPAAAPTNPHGAGELPPGHPGVNDSDVAADDDDDATDEGLPPGHPAPTRSPSPAAQQPRLPEDQSNVDDSLAPGVIVVEARDGSDNPVPRANITLGILQQSVAKGESRRHVSRQADESGVVRFDGLETGAGMAYRVTVPWGDGDDPATYAAMPFQLDLHHGQHVRVHVYPVTHDVREALVGMEGILYVELKDDALQFDEFFRVYNMGAVTWVPHGVVASLPQGFKAFNTQREMSDTGFDEAPGQGAKLRGTFSPGMHDTHFRYQIPYEGDDSVDFTLGLPPRVAQMRVIAEASRGMTLRAEGFKAAVPNRNQRGQRVLVTERTVRAGEPGLNRLHVTLDNIPIEGSSKWIATALAAATVALGIYLATQQARTGQKLIDAHDSERARTRLVAEIAALDRARRAGEVGPSAYARIHAALIDSLARLLPMEPMEGE